MRIFVTGIGTEIGKTISSAIICKALDAEYFKPIQAGDLDFIWDGNNDDGERMPAGKYTIAAYGQVGGSTEQLKTSVVARVESVNLGGAEGRILLNLTGLGQIEFSEVKEIG